MFSCFSWYGFYPKTFLPENIGLMENTADFPFRQATTEEPLLNRSG
jgi:hypothetical protein